MKKPGIIEQWGGKSALFFTYTHLSHDLTTGLLAALLPFIRQDLKLDYLQAGFLVSANALASGFAQFVGGWLSDRLGPRKAISLGLAGVGISGAAIILAHSYSILVAIFIIMGILSGLYHPSAGSTRVPSSSWIGSLMRRAVPSASGSSCPTLISPCLQG